MTNIFKLTSRPDEALFYSRGDKNDPRMGDVVRRDPKYYETADIVILGCPQDEGVRRNNGRAGAADAPKKIREQFYKLTSFNVKKRIFDLGDVVIGSTLEETHDTHLDVVKQILADGKRLIVLGGGNDVSYPDGRAMSEVFGADSWLAVNVDAHLDVRIAEERNSGTPYRQLLEENLLRPNAFYEVGFQTHFCSPIYYDYIRDLGVHRVSLELLRSRFGADDELREQIKQNFINHSSSVSTFFGFDVDAVRSSDAPGVSARRRLGCVR